MSLAVPVKDGVVSLDGDAGCFRVTVGEAVSTVNVLTALSPVLPASSVCVA